MVHAEATVPVIEQRTKVKAPTTPNTEDSVINLSHLCHTAQLGAGAVRGSADQMLPKNQDRLGAGGFALAELLLLGMAGWLLVRLVLAIVTPVGAVGESRAAAPPATDTAVFGRFDPFFRKATESGTAQVSSLALVLLGTRVDTVSGRGGAIIADAQGKQSSYLVGEAIEPGVTLKAVGFDNVTLDAGGRTETLFLDQSAGGPPVTPPAETSAISFAPPAAVSALTPSSLAGAVAITPRLRGTEIAGFVVAPRGDGTAFRAAGLQPGDVVITIDGASVAGLGDPAAIMRRIEAGAALGIERGGAMTNLRLGAR